MQISLSETYNINTVFINHYNIFMLTAQFLSHWQNIDMKAWMNIKYVDINITHCNISYNNKIRFQFCSIVFVFQHHVEAWMMSQFFFYVINMNQCFVFNLLTYFETMLRLKSSVENKSLKNSLKKMK